VSVGVLVMGTTMFAMRSAMAPATPAGPASRPPTQTSARAWFPPAAATTRPSPPAPSAASPDGGRD
jgi:hypothetical protein